MAIKLRKSQVSIFIILGVVLILAVFLIMAVNNSYIKNHADSEIAEAAVNSLIATPIRNLVEQCLWKVSKESLEKAGQQSGFLFISQGGSTPDYNPSEDGKTFVYYGGIKVAILDDGLPSLKKGSGENSIEDQLESFVEKNIGSCINFSTFEKEGLKVYDKEKTVDAGVNENNVVFSLDYPLTIKNPDGGTIGESSFFSAHKIRLKKIHEFVRRYIHNPIADSDISAIIEKDDSGLFDVIIVNDEKSLSGGIPYKYLFAMSRKIDRPNLITGAAVSEANSIPVAYAGPNRTVALLESTLLFGSGEDADNDQITFKWQLIDKPGGSSSILSGDNLPNPSFVPDLDGDYKFSLRANDGKAFSDTSHVTITAKSPDSSNTKPLAYPGQERNTDAGKNTIIPGFGNDNERENLMYLWMISKKPSGSRSMLKKPNAQSLLFNPDIIGSYVLKLIVNDGKEDSIPVEVKIEASTSSENRAPSADAGYDRNVKAGIEATLLGNGFDPDNDVLAYSWAIMSKPAGSKATLSNNNIANPTFIPDTNGNYKFSLIVDDGRLASALSTVNYTIRDVTRNNRPAANAGVDRNININQETELHGTGFDKDLVRVSYRWSIEAAPAGSRAFLSNPNAKNPVFIPDKNGNFIFILAVNDGKEDSMIDKVVLSASEPGINRAPSADAGYDRNVKAGIEATLLGNGFDPDNDKLTFTWSIIEKPSESLAALSNINSANPLFIPDMEGDYKFSLKVKDAQTTSQASLVTYTSKPVTGNNKPTANAGADIDINVGKKIELSGKGSDIDNNHLFFRWSIADKPASSSASFSNPNTESPLFTADSPGQYRIFLITNDGREDSNADDAVINVAIQSQQCTYGACNINGKQWCNNGVFVSLGYCDNCGNQDSSCPTCTGNVCDASNKKWCENGLWKQGTDSQYCSRCNYVDSNCPICESNACDLDNRRWCTSSTWSSISYCQNCGPVDASCNVECTNNTCDIKNKKICKNGVWQTDGYCFECGGVDSSCFSECTSNACDIKNKKWCNNGVWDQIDYCSRCGGRDISCGATCSNNICDATSNKWCNNGAWDSLNYCGKCQDSECLGACTSNACDINAKKWCNNGKWVSADYCGMCGSKDSSCIVACVENTCDTTSNKKCSNGKWTSLNYCDSCSLKDSDCTIQCAEGQCDLSNRKVCMGRQWTNSSYCDFCASFDASCPLNCSIRKDSICDKNCIAGMDPDCLDINLTGKTRTINVTCVDNSECASRICSKGICAEPSCSDYAKNGEESDVDCGGNCEKCSNSKLCVVGADCMSDTCSSGICVDANICNDNILNGEETDVDCGGGCPNKCGLAKNCASNQDCENGLECISNLCSKPKPLVKKDADLDTDGDGIPDEWEIRNGLDPNDASDANLDFDDDGLINIQEYTFGTNPNNPDSDGDGVSDKEEIEKGTIPTDPVSRPGGIAGLLIWSIIIIIIFGIASYGIYYYKDFFIGLSRRKPQDQMHLAQEYSPYRLIPRIVKPQKKVDIKNIVMERRAMKERKRSRLLEAFGKAPKEKAAKTPSREKNGNPDIFSRLKSISKK